MGPTAQGISQVSVGNAVYTLFDLHHSGRASQGISRASQGGRCRVGITTTLYPFRQVMASDACSRTADKGYVSASVASELVAYVVR